MWKDSFVRPKNLPRASLCLQYLLLPSSFHHETRECSAWSNENACCAEHYMIELGFFRGPKGGRLESTWARCQKHPVFFTSPEQESRPKS